MNLWWCKPKHSMYAIYAYIDPPGTTPIDRHTWQSHGVSGKISSSRCDFFRKHRQPPESANIRLEEHPGWRLLSPSPRLAVSLLGWHGSTLKRETTKQIGGQIIPGKVRRLEINKPGPSKGCPMNYPTLPIGFHWAPLGGSWNR